MFLYCQNDVTTMTTVNAFQLWYRAGGEEAVEQEKEAANLAGTWQQFSLMTRGRREPRDPEQVPTRSVSVT